MKKRKSSGLINLCFVLTIVSFPLMFFWTQPLSAQEKAKGPAEKILKVGTTLPLSGPAAAWGLPMTRLMDFFAEDTNARGGLKIGKEVYKISTVYYDNKGSPSEAAACATKLVHDDKIQYLIGGVIAATGMAELPVTQPAKVVTTSCWWGKGILGPDKLFSFRQTISQNEIAPAI